MDYTKLPRRSGDAYHVVVETPRGATTKYKFEPALGALTISRLLPLGVAYPFDWGFVPGTRAPDGDPVDAIVLYDGASFPGCVLRCRPLGVVRVSQKGKDGGRERNDRVVFTLADEPRHADWSAHEDLPKRTRDELERFFDNAVAFRGKDVELLGWGDKTEAERQLAGDDA